MPREADIKTWDGFIFVILLPKNSAKIAEKLKTEGK